MDGDQGYRPAEARIGCWAAMQDPRDRHPRPLEGPTGTATPVAAGSASGSATAEDRVVGSTSSRPPASVGPAVQVRCQPPPLMCVDEVHGSS